MDTAGEQLAEATADAEKAGTVLSRLAKEWRDTAARVQAEPENVQARVKDFWWSNAWPGDAVADCPPPRR